MCQLCEQFVSRKEFEEFKQSMLRQLEDARKCQPEAPAFARAGELGRMLGCSASTLRRYRINGLLHPKKVNGVWLYDLAEVRKLAKTK